MYHYEDDKKQLTAKEIVDRFGVGYYEISIEEYQTRIANILAGNGDTNGEVVFMSESAMKTKADRDRRVASLKKQIAACEERINEIKEAISVINHSAYVLDEAAKSTALLRGLTNSLSDCFLKYEDVSKTNGELVIIPSDTYDEIFKNKIAEKFGANVKSEYRKLYSKEIKKAEAPVSKVKKDIYAKVKSIKGLSVVENDNHYRYGHSQNKYDYSSLQGVLEENNYTVDGFADRLYRDIGNQYDYNNIETLASLGVEVDKVKRAIDISNGAERMFDQFGPILDSMQRLEEEYSIQNRFKTFYYLKNDIKKVDKLSREVECLDLIIDAFDNTSIKDTDLFKHLIEIYRKQNNKLNKLMNKVNEVYSRSGLKELLEAESRLKDLSRQSIELQARRIRTYDEFGEGPSFDYTYSVEDKIRTEMLAILLKYPELNKPIYGINLEQYNKRGKYIGDKITKEQDVKEISRPIKVEDEEPFVPTIVVTEEELKRDLGIVEESQEQEQKNPWKPANETIEDDNNFEIPYDLSSVRTDYYNRYMFEKVKGTELGQMNFSEYLENVAPDLKELIEIEKRRENRAKNVFKLYVQYLASIEDKSQAMRFTDFAKLRHGLEKDDLPYEYSDEEVKKRLSL